MSGRYRTSPSARPRNSFRANSKPPSPSTASVCADSAGSSPKGSTSRTTRAIPCSTPKNWERPSAKAPCYTRKSLSGTYFWTRQKSISILRETGNSTSRSSSPDWAATPPNRRTPRGWPSATCGFPTRASCSATKGPTPSPRESISEIWCSTDSTSGATDSISTGEPSRWISPPCHSATSAASRSATSPQASSPWATA